MSRPHEPVAQATGRALLSKRRFREISDALRAEISDAAAVERVLDRIREIMRFDERAAFAADKRQKKRAVVGTRLWGQQTSALHDMLG